MKRVFLFFLLVIALQSCIAYEEINGPCLVFLVTGPGERERFYEIREDIRRDKSTGVFTYRDENGKLWSISLGTDGNFYSKSTNATPILVDRIECGDKVYNQRPRVDENDG
jgi:hypothetical protein